MAKSENQKLKILYIYDILCKYTDENGGVTMQEILQKLEGYGISAERKSVYSDIFALSEIYGADIEMVKTGGKTYYCMMSRLFELPELKLLVDAVSASKFITHKKSDELIKKIETLTSKNHAKKLRTQLFVTGRIKNMNETIYYNVDAVNEAISENRQISFGYFEYLPGGKKRLRREGKQYVVSPLALCWADENYYLVALENDNIKHYRVDKMQSITCLEDKRKLLDDFDSAQYSKTVFGMYGGREETVTLCCNNSIAGAVIDRFGKDIIMIMGEDTFDVTVKIKVSPQFFAWLSGFADNIRITYPKSVIDEYKKHIEKIASLY